MPALFGYFDPDHLLGESVIPRMKEAIPAYPSQVADTITTDWGGIGIVNYGGRPGIAGAAGVGRYAVLGELESLGGRAMPHGEIAEQCFGQGPAVGRLPEIRGGFVAARLDEAARKITLISDRQASYPLYVARHGSAMIFASQVKAILAVFPGKVELDRVSVATMLSIGEVIGNRTLVEGVETLPAAMLMSFSPEGVHQHGYWQYRYEENRQCSWDDAVDRTGLALQGAVQRAIQSGPALAVPLSGGLDSRFILDLACQAGATPTAYTWGTPGCRDIEYARQVARRLKCRHEVYFFEPDYLRHYAMRGVWLTEGHTPATNFHVLPYVDTLAEHGHELILDGFAGDGVLGGNFINSAWLNQPDAHVAAEAIWQWRRQGFDGGWEAGALLESHAIAGEAFRQLYQTYPGQSSMDRAMAFLIDNRVRRITTCGTELFRSRMLVKQPFMDADVTEAIRTLPHLWRKRHHFYLAVLKRYGRASVGAAYQRTMLPASAPHALNVASMAFQRGYGLLEKRMGFPALFKGKSPSDFPGWFRIELKSFVEEILLSERALSRGVVPPDVARQAIAMHTAGERELSSLIGAMLSIEIFCRLFLDDFTESQRRMNAVVA